MFAGIVADYAYFAEICRDLFETIFQGSNNDVKKSVDKLFRKP